MTVNTEKILEKVKEDGYLELLLFEEVEKNLEFLRGCGIPSYHSRKENLEYIIGGVYNSFYIKATYVAFITSNTSSKIEDFLIQGISGIYNDC